MPPFRSSTETTAASAQISGDFNALHLDPNFAATTAFCAPSLHGSQTLTLAVDQLLTARPGFQGCEIRFLAPAAVGAQLLVRLLPDPDAAEAAPMAATDDQGTRLLEGRARFSPASSQSEAKG